MSRLLQESTLIIFFAGMFLLEAILALWTGNPYDLKVWFNTGSWMNQGINIYQPNDHLGYPPLWSIWCLVAYRAYLFFGSNPEIWRLIIKLPIIFSHLACAYIVGKYASSRFGQKTGIKILLTILTWSFFVYIGAIWGQIDTISALFAFLAFYAVVTKRTAVSAIFLGLAIALKLYPIILLPVFFIYVLKNWSKKEAAKYLLFAFAVPVLLTLLIFGVFQWNLSYLFNTILATTPASGTSPTQFNIGCMNFFSFLAVNNINSISYSRTLWIPFLSVCGLYWLRKKNFGESELVLSIISFYLLFMVTYGWISEQTFLDPTVFILIFIIGFNPKRIYFFILGAIQAFVYVFTVANRTLVIFTPLLEKFSPSGLNALNSFHQDNGPLIWVIRGYMGLIVSISLVCFLVLLLWPRIIDKAHEWLNRQKGLLRTL